MKRILFPAIAVLALLVSCDVVDQPAKEPKTKKLLSAKAYVEAPEETNPAMLEQAFLSGREMNLDFTYEGGKIVKMVKDIFYPETVMYSYGDGYTDIMFGEGPYGKYSYLRCILDDDGKVAEFGSVYNESGEETDYSHFVTADYDDAGHFLSFSDISAEEMWLEYYPQFVWSGNELSGMQSEEMDLLIEEFGFSEAPYFEPTVYSSCSTNVDVSAVIRLFLYTSAGGSMLPSETDYLTVPCLLGTRSEHIVQYESAPFKTSCSPLGEALIDGEWKSLSEYDHGAYSLPPGDYKVRNNTPQVIQVSYPGWDWEADSDGAVTKGTWKLDLQTGTCEGDLTVHDKFVPFDVNGDGVIDEKDGRRITVSNITSQPVGLAKAYFVIEFTYE